VAEVLVQFADPVADDTGKWYRARACGAELDNSRWQGWLEFLPGDGGPAVRSGRETTQPNRTDTEYWATGLTAVYLEGALRRALKPLVRPAEPAIPPPQFDGPAGEDLPAATVESILNPFSVYRKGEALLRAQLGALSAWHLVNIIRAHRLSDASGSALSAMPTSALIHVIVDGVRRASVRC
jgi:hypothetical protein